MVCGVEIGADLRCRLHGRPAPEAVADPGRDDQRVISLDECFAVVAAAGDGSCGQIDFGQGALDDPNRIQTTESVERDPIVAGPVARAGQPDTEVLAADQPWVERNTRDVERFGEPDRDENAYIAQARDYDAFAAHAAKL